MPETVLRNGLRPDVDWLRRLVATAEDFPLRSQESAARVAAVAVHPRSEPDSLDASTTGIGLDLAPANHGRGTAGGGHVETATAAAVGVPVAEREMAPPAVVFSHVAFAFDDHVVLSDVSFCVPRGSTRFILGASGSGKSVMLKLIAGLLRPDSGAVTVNGQRVDTMRERDLLQMRSDIGVVFQENALFDSLTVADNVGYRLYEETDMPEDDVRTRIAEVLGLVGLGEFTERLPSELSGGQRRRVAIARAMAAKPSLLLYDDPTTGLDPIIATTVDDQIVKLRDTERVTSIIATHQIRDAYYIATHQAVRADGSIRVVPSVDLGGERAQFMVLHEGRIHYQGSGAELLASPDPYLRRFLHQTLPPW